MNKKFMKFYLYKHYEYGKKINNLESINNSKFHLILDYSINWFKIILSILHF